MFSHLVIFWTDPTKPRAIDDLIAGAERHLKSIPGILFFHAGRMVAGDRAVIEKSYQVALNVVFPSQEARESYRAHPGHDRFKHEFYEPNCVRCLVYDFE